MPFEILKGDITKQRVDAIVNAANTRLEPGSGVCGAIFRAAGSDGLEKECKQIGRISTGDAVITSGYALPARYVIHAAGPVWEGGSHGEKEKLEDCYRNSLSLAWAKGLSSIAFPVISSGIYGYPKRQAVTVAVSTITEFLNKANSDMNVYLIVFDQSSFDIDPLLQSDIDEYIAYFITGDNVFSELSKEQPAARAKQLKPSEEETVPESLSEFGIYAFRGGFDGGMQDRPKSFRQDPSFSERLRKLLIAKNLDDVDVYKRANLSRQHWSKIISTKDYQPGKKTVFALAISMRLNLDETKDLLLAAGFALSHSHLFDIIIEYFIEHQKYNVFEINEVLFKYEQPLLG